MKLLLLVSKIIKNPQRALFALCRRVRAVFLHWYVWIYWRFGFLKLPQEILDTFNSASDNIPSLIPHQFLSSESSVINEAYITLNWYGDFLGVQINDPLPPWNEDVRLRASNDSARFFGDGWYTTIKIPMHIDKGIGPDIKVPWMLGRLNHVSLWAYAYFHTQDKIFLDAIEKHLNDFFSKNPPYFGVQWMCTMEVSLHAINLILSFSLLNEHISKDLKNQIINSLQYHWWYIRHHWELYDGKTNNHYLSNLVGYWWLCSFFTIYHREREWCVKKLIEEVAKQQLPDGAFYEGSTAYHRLSTDLVAIALAIDSDNLLYSLKEKYRIMEKVDSSFEYDENKQIFIGDNDSSPVLHPQLLRLVRQKQQPLNGIFSLPHFGLDIYKNDSLHVTVRQHVYRAEQPSGHFHDDCNAITVAINKTVCIVDPGTYVYTSSLPWRNKLRDVSTHGTCYIPGKKNWDNCFANNVPAQKYQGAPIVDNESSFISANCSCRGFLHERFVAINASQKMIKLTDTISKTSERIIWQLPVRGTILRISNDMIEFNTDGVIWQICGQQKWCINFSSYAPSYGILEPIIYISMVVDDQKTIETKITWN